MNIKSLILLFAVVLLLVGPVSAYTDNLSQLYPDMDPYVVTWENAPADWRPSLNNSAIIWTSFTDIRTTDTIDFILTMNNGDQIHGEIVSKDTWPWYSEVTTTLGPLSNTTGYPHIPWVGIGPRYTLTYGALETGEVYLVLLEESRTGGGPYAHGGILLDLALDPNVQVNPPVVNPIIRMQTTSTTGLKIWGYTLTASQLSHRKPSSVDIVGTMQTVWGTASMFFFQFIGFLVGFVVPNLFLLIGVEKGLMALYFLRKKGNIVAAMGAFVDTNMKAFDLFSGYLERVVSALYMFIQAVFKWL